MLSTICQLPMYIQLDNITLKLMTVHVQLSNGNIKQDVNFNEPMLFNEESDTWSMPMFNINFGVYVILANICVQNEALKCNIICACSQSVSVINNCVI